MKTTTRSGHSVLGLFVLALLLAPQAWAQEPPENDSAAPSPPSAQQPDSTAGLQDSGQDDGQDGDQDPATGDSIGKKIGDKAEDVASKVSDVAKSVDESEKAREASAGVLKPIYKLAQFMSFPAFHWLAFSLMVAGVVSFAGQLVLGKLVMLANLHFSVMEILADSLGLAISLVGLVLTTQAAADNSTFTTSPAMVLSATIVGAIFGLVCYLQGQSQELLALRAARAKQGPPKEQVKK